MQEQIEKLLEEHIKPALAGHGGGIELVEVKDNKAFVKLQGGCRGCAGARATIKDGVERFLKENIPELEEVVDVTDHNA